MWDTAVQTDALLTQEILLKIKQNTLIMKKWILSNKLYFIGALVGASGGFLYYKYVGCLTGTCAITSNPFSSTIYFAFIGAILFGVFKKDQKFENSNNG